MKNYNPNNLKDFAKQKEILLKGRIKNNFLITKEVLNFIQCPKRTDFLTQDVKIIFRFNNELLSRYIRVGSILERLNIWTYLNDCRKYDIQIASSSIIFKTKLYNFNIYLDESSSIGKIKRNMHIGFNEIVLKQIGVDFQKACFFNDGSTFEQHLKANMIFE